MIKGTQYSDEMLSAFLDGELPPEEARAVGKAIETDAELSRRLAELRQADEIVRAAYGAIDERPLPESLRNLLEEGEAQDGDPAPESDDNVLRFPARPLVEGLYRWALPLAASIALVVGLGVGSRIDWRGGNDGVNAPSLQLASVITDGQPLFDVLERGESAREYRLDGEITVEPVLTFATTSGAYCREFTAASQNAATHAVACREDSQWRLALSIATPPAAPGGDTYETATAETGAVIDRYINERIAAAPLSAADEAALIDRAWKD